MTWFKRGDEWINGKKDAGAGDAAAGGKASVSPVKESDVFDFPGNTGLSFLQKQSMTNIKRDLRLFVLPGTWDIKDLWNMHNRCGAIGEELFNRTVVDFL